MGQTRMSTGRATVRTRILATMLVVTALGMTISGLVAYQAQRSFVVDQVDEALRTQLDLAQRALEDAGVASVRDGLERILSLTVAPQDGGSFGLVDDDIAYLAGVPEQLDAAGVPELVAAAARAEDAHIDTVDAGGRSLRYLVVPLHVEGDPEAGAYVAAIDLGARLEGVTRSAGISALVSAAVLVLTGILGWFVAGRLLAPVRRLREAAERITLNALGERIPVDGEDDVSRLTATVNRMLDRIGDGVAQQRGLLADLRHELRAPLTLVRGHLELVDVHDPRDVEQVRRIATEEVDRMARMLDELARVVELGLPSTDRVVLAADDLARDVLDRAHGIPGPVWQTGRLDPARISVDRDRVLEAWLQLVDNAARHAPPGTPVVLSAEAADDRVRLTVRDRGPGVPPGEEALVFRRGERGSAPAGAGSGLGLAIVAAIARAHGGSAEVRPAPGGGAEFAIVLPRATGEGDG